MKRIIFSIAVAMMATVGLRAQDATAAADGSDIMFGVQLPARNGLSAEASKLLKNKVEQILGRCNAGAAGDRDVFVVQPTINAGDVSTAEGMVQSVTKASGELVLEARNRYDGAVYYSTTVPLSAVVKGEVDTDLALARSIKPTDAVYVRFVRNARKNVAQYAAAHPEVYQIPEAPEPATPVIVVVVPDQQPAAAPQPPAPTPAPAPVADTTPVGASPADAEIYFSQPGWEGTVKSCTYDASTRSIHLVMGFKSTDRKDRGEEYTTIRSAIDTEGAKYHNFAVDEFYHRYPYGIPVTVNFYIRDVYSNPGSVPFIEVGIGYCQVEIRNVQVR